MDEIFSWRGKGFKSMIALVSSLTNLWEYVKKFVKVF